MSEKDSFELFPGFKVPPIDPSREVKRPPLTIAPAAEEEKEDLPQEDYEDSDQDTPCAVCEGWGYLDCFCGGDFCVCRCAGEIPCPNCG